MTADRITIERETLDRKRFEAFVQQEMGDVAVAYNGRYISPKINNYWRTWRAALAAQPADAQCSPTLTECPRCKNDIFKCDGLRATPGAEGA